MKKEYLKYKVYVSIFVLIVIVGLFLKTFVFPVPNIQDIKHLTKEYIQHKSDFSTGTIIYSRDYGNISGIDSWRVDISNEYNQLICTLRYHPITGRIISVKEAE